MVQHVLAREPSSVWYNSCTILKKALEPKRLWLLTLICYVEQTLNQSTVCVYVHAGKGEGQYTCSLLASSMQTLAVGDCSSCEQKVSYIL